MKYKLKYRNIFSLIVALASCSNAFAPDALSPDQQQLFEADKATTILTRAHVEPDKLARSILDNLAMQRGILDLSTEGVKDFLLENPDNCTTAAGQAAACAIIFANTVIPNDLDVGKANGKGILAQLTLMSIFNQNRVVTTITNLAEAIEDKNLAATLIGAINSGLFSVLSNKVQSTDFILRLHEWYYAMLTHVNAKVPVVAPEPVLEEEAVEEAVATAGDGDAASDSDEGDATSGTGEGEGEGEVDDEDEQQQAVAAPLPVLPEGRILFADALGKYDPTKNKLGTAFRKEHRWAINLMPAEHAGAGTAPESDFVQLQRLITSNAPVIKPGDGWTEDVLRIMPALPDFTPTDYTVGGTEINEWIKLAKWRRNYTTRAIHLRNVKTNTSAPIDCSSVEKLQISMLQRESWFTEPARGWFRQLHALNTNELERFLATGVKLDTDISGRTVQQWMGVFNDKLWFEAHPNRVLLVRVAAGVLTVATLGSVALVANPYDAKQALQELSSRISGVFSGALSKWRS